MSFRAGGRQSHSKWTGDRQMMMAHLVFAGARRNVPSKDGHKYDKSLSG